MRLLLDECCAPGLARALRGAGHDVRHVLDADRGGEDDAVIKLAADDARVLVTEDETLGSSR